MWVQLGVLRLGLGDDGLALLTHHDTFSQIGASQSDPRAIWAVMTTNKCRLRRSHRHPVAQYQYLAFA